jgi:hypothetical protein
VVAYDHSKGQRLHISVINSVYSTSITGLPSSPSPVTLKMYLENKFPGFRLYDKHIPTASNTSTPTPLSKILSVFKRCKQTGETDGSTSRAREVESLDRGYCTHEMATQRCRPCGHAFCDDFSDTKTCLLCQMPIQTRNRIAATMRLPGEGEDSVEALSLDEDCEVACCAKNSDALILLCARPCCFFFFHTLTNMPRNFVKLANPYVEFEYCYYIVIFLMSHSIIDGVIDA